ncbi:MAG: helix-turn-helix domain-containing protein, partial [Bullifex sp.]
MQDLIKTIRHKLNVNQEQLASLMGVSPVTVNRWENGKTNPSLMAQKQLYDICLSHQLDLADYIVEREQTYENMHVLYHASRFGLSGNIQPISRNRCDFGRGFYMGTDPIQPLTLVCNEKNPVFYTLEFDMENLSVLEVEMGIDWAMLIAYYRGYMDDRKESPV